VGPTLEFLLVALNMQPNVDQPQEAGEVMMMMGGRRGAFPVPVGTLLSRQGNM
jgi:hypothetical protein